MTNMKRITRRIMIGATGDHEEHQGEDNEEEAGHEEDEPPLKGTLGT